MNWDQCEAVRRTRVGVFLTPTEARHLTPTRLASLADLPLAGILQGEVHRVCRRLSQTRIKISGTRF